jgi:hypothetical protein
MSRGCMTVPLARMFVLLMFAALAITVIGLPDLAAAPANGRAIGEAAAATSPITKVPCAMRRVCGRYGCASRRVCW